MVTIKFAAVFCAGALACLPLAAGAKPVALDSAVYVEHSGTTGDGRFQRALVPALRLIRGDRVICVISWDRSTAARMLTVVNPVPRAVAYQASARDDDEVSADGGRTWGQLGTLRYGARLASPEDITHVRWRVAGAVGQIAYSAIVR